MAIANIVKTSLGPVGLDKMLVRFGSENIKPYAGVLVSNFRGTFTSSNWFDLVASSDDSFVQTDIAGGRYW